jgi:hypothetical protein
MADFAPPIVRSQQLSHPAIAECPAIRGPQTSLVPPTLPTTTHPKAEQAGADIEGITFNPGATT